MIQIERPIAVSDVHGRTWGEVNKFDLDLQPTLFGSRLICRLQISSSCYGSQTAPTLRGMEVEASIFRDNNHLLLGKLVPSICGLPASPLGKLRTVTAENYLSIAKSDLLLLAEGSWGKDVSLALRVCPHFLEAEPAGVESTGFVKVPRSDWLSLMGKSGLARFEFVVIRTPVSTSHLYLPFSAAIDKIREAETEYSKGNWNSAAGACRDAWNTVLSAVPGKKEERIETLLGHLNGDPRRKKFAAALTRGLHDILNAAKHLEGDQKDGTPPADLKPEDALLCIHWYAAIIGYL